MNEVGLGGLRGGAETVRRLGKPMWRWLRALFFWFISPSLTALIAMLVTVASLVTAAFVITPETAHGLILKIAGPAIFREPELYLFDRMEKFYARPDHNRTEIAIVGGSTTRENIWTEAALAEDIAKFGGGSVDVVDLTTSAQSTIVSWALAELVACNGAEFVVVGVNASRLRALSLYNPLRDIGFLGPELRAFVDSGAVNPGAARLGNRLVPSPEFVTRTILWAASEWLGGIDGVFDRDRSQIRPIVELWRHVYLERPISESHQRTRMGNLEKEFGKVQELQVGPLDSIRQTVERCGAKLIFLLPAENPLFFDPALYPHFVRARSELLALLASPAFRDIPAINLRDLVNYSASDYADWGHLRNPERIRQSTAAIAQALAPQVGALHND